MINMRTSTTMSPAGGGGGGGKLAVKNTQPFSVLKQRVLSHIECRTGI
jgi:hypothetical protein